MSSAGLTIKNVELIKRLVLEVSKYGTTRDAARERQAATTAATRIEKNTMSEEELRAVIYDAVFGHAARPALA